MCIKLVSIKELYFGVRPTKSQDLHCKTSKTDMRNLILCNLYEKLCIKLVSIKELYYDARPTKSQDLHCKTSKTDMRNLILCNLYEKLCIKLVSIKELYYDARPTKSQHLPSKSPALCHSDHTTVRKSIKHKFPYACRSAVPYAVAVLC